MRNQIRFYISKYAKYLKRISGNNPVIKDIISKKNNYNSKLILLDNFKELKIAPSTLPNPSKSNQSPQKAILWFSQICKYSGIPKPNGWEALHIIIEISW